jgi:hypothetical protein
MYVFSCLQLHEPYNNTQNYDRIPPEKKSTKQLKIAELLGYVLW